MYVAAIHQRTDMRMSGSVNNMRIVSFMHCLSLITLTSRGVDTLRTKGHLLNDSVYCIATICNYPIRYTDANEFLSLMTSLCKGSTLCLHENI